MLSDKETARLALCDSLQLRLLQQSGASVRASAGPSFAEIAPVGVYALFGAHGIEDVSLTDVMDRIGAQWSHEGLLVNPFVGNLGDVRLSLLYAMAMVLRRDAAVMPMMRDGVEHLGVANALPDYVDLRTRKALAGSRHSAVATALAVELLTSLIFVERGTYLSIAPVPVPELFAGDGIDAHGLQSAFGELSVRLQRNGDKVQFSMHSDFLRGVSAIELNFPWELRELVARKGTVKYVTGGTIVMEPADLIEGEAVATNPGPS
jgi:hypothetical protein